MPEQPTDGPDIAGASDEQVRLEALLVADRTQQQHDGEAAILKAAKAYAEFVRPGCTDDGAVS